MKDISSTKKSGTSSVPRLAYSRSQSLVELFHLPILRRLNFFNLFQLQRGGGSFLVFDSDCRKSRSWDGVLEGPHFSHNNEILI